MSTFDLGRFKEAQARDYDTALAEIRAGHKRTHWIWYIFPQLQGFGKDSPMCRKYGIYGLEEATAYYADPYLSAHLIEISQALLDQPCRDADVVLGWSVDARKVRRSMTLFACVEGSDPVFRQVLDEFYGGKPDKSTLELLGVKWD